MENLFSMPQKTGYYDPGKLQPAGRQNATYHVMGRFPLLHYVITIHQSYRQTDEWMDRHHAFSVFQISRGSMATLIK